MTRLLISVRDATEAQLAIGAGADLIDVKEPDAGSLGAAAPEVVADVVRIAAGRRSVSAALGELCDRSTVELRAFFAEPALASLAYAKLGLAGCAAISDWPGRWESALRIFPSTVAAVAVAYADWERAASPPPKEVIAVGRRLGCRALLIDTFDKGQPGLLGQWSLVELSRHVRLARGAGMLVVLGGRIGPDDFATLLPLEPDFLAVRGAVCHSDRKGRLDAALARAAKQRLDGLAARSS